jgi:hypothetical protein
MSGAENRDLCRFRLDGFAESAKDIDIFATSGK